jgi:hypothetical protein
MSKRRYSEVEIIGALKQMEAGRSAAEGAGAGSEQAHRVRMESEVRRDERGGGTAAATAGSLDNDMLNAVIEKNGWSS